MEHRLITGEGAQWLPFARSCITKLKKLNLGYAGQSFEIDGASIKVRIEPGHEYIRIEGGGCTLLMDSGVMDVITIAPGYPGTPGELLKYLPGILYEAGSAITYNANFTEVKDGAKLNPSKLSDGQLSGDLVAGVKFKGYIRPQQSFAPRLIDVSPATDPPTKQSDPADDTLWIKKRTAILCPASIFTGRTRLWVQAMYGLHLNEYTKDGSAKRTNPPMEFIAETAAAPALWIPPYVRKGDEAYYPDILLDTSCGVWLDTTTGEHWLIHVGDIQINMYPLMSSPCGERVRHFLKVSNTALSVVDKHHLETYILARSLPDSKFKVRSADSNSAGRFSMGYGWHWNYSGTRADIVVNFQYAQDNIDTSLAKFGMESTHYMLIPAQTKLSEPEGGWKPDDIRFTWGSPVTVVEGPTKWAVSRYYFPILEPDYSIFALSKITTQFSNLFACDAPFYCFYEKDELQMCRVKAEYVDTVPGYIVENNVFGPEGWTIGMNTGDRTVFEDTPAHFKYTFTCGATSSGVLPYGKVTPWPNKRVISNKTAGEWISTGDGFGSYATRYLNISDDFGGNAAIVAVTSYYLAPEHKVVSFDSVSSSGHTEEWGIAKIVVPFWDAEACYMQWYSRRDDYYDSHAVGSYHHSAGMSYSFLNRHVCLGPLEGDVPYYFSFSGQGAPGTSTVDSLDNTIPPPVLTEVAKDEILVAKGGARPAAFIASGEFHDNASAIVQQTFPTLSSVSSTDPVIIARALPANVGISASVAAPAIIGWV